MLKIKYKNIETSEIYKLTTEIYNEDTNKCISLESIKQEKARKNAVIQYTQDTLHLKENIDLTELYNIQDRLSPNDIVEYMELDNKIIVSYIKFPELINLIQTSNKPIIGQIEIPTIRYIRNSIISLTKNEYGYNIINPLKNLSDIKNIYNNTIGINSDYKMKDEIEYDIKWMRDSIKSSIIECSEYQLRNKITVHNNKVVIKETNIGDDALKNNASILITLNRINHIYQDIVRGFITKTRVGGEVLRYNHPGKAFIVYILPYLGVDNIIKTINALDDFQNTILKDILPLEAKNLIETNKMIERLYNATNDSYLADRLENAKFNNADEVTDILINAIK